MSGQRAPSIRDRIHCEDSRCAQPGDGVARASHQIDDPIAKLRYLRSTVHADLNEAPAHETLRMRVRRILRRAALLSGREGPPSAQRTSKRALGAVAALAFVLVPAIIAAIASQFLSPPIAPAEAQAPQAAAAGLATPQLASPAAAAPPLVAESLPESLGVAPTSIWLADRGADWELYSNGLRIETAQTIAGAPRRFRVHDRNSGVQARVYDKPIGIMFHTSESDLWPLEESFQQDLRRTSAALVRYIRQQRAYNYLIDRFGRVYRVVDDATKANHAGHGVWARGDEVYLDLNNAFIGVSFESRWEGGRTLPITRAQLIAGRNLTHYLQQRFAIAPEMCVTHGLTSVSPRQQLIGYHRDWARGFPFEAFGLPDLYVRPTPSVALFGFNYDEHFLRTVGEPWPGLAAAERLLADEAQARGVPVAALRKERQSLYAKWSREAAQASATEPSAMSAARE